MKKYYSTEEVEQGIKDNDGVEIIPPIEKKTQNTLRSKRKLAYQKIGGKAYYTLLQIQNYIESNKIEAVAS